MSSDYILTLKNLQVACLLTLHIYWHLLPLILAKLVNVKIMIVPVYKPKVPPCY